MSSALPAKNVQAVSHLSSYQLDPLGDARWAELVDRHPGASIFHSVGWLNALRLTYAYEPVVFTTSSPASELTNGIVACRINSWLTGRRLVSLPFSDHCEPLHDSTDGLNFLIRNLQDASEHQQWKYLELRPIHRSFGGTTEGIGLFPAETYCLHTIDLRPTLDELFRTLDKDCVQRRVRRAQRAGLVEKCGRSEELLKEFYALFSITRARHGVPPTPYAWFQNLISCLGQALEIRVAYTDNTPIAAILTSKFRKVVYYKYGCSDPRFNKFGATPWLLWRAIESAKSNGATDFDMGRTQKDNAGLLTFKNHWASESKPLVYWRFPKGNSLDRIHGWQMDAAKRIFSHMPDRLLKITGRFLYRHIG
jgi:Acetyltransferase (GNAT) domain